MGLNFDDIKIGDCFSVTKFISSETVKFFAEVSGDTNPIHLSKSFAKKTRFGRRVVHGALVLGFISKILGVDFPGRGSILLELNANFLNPIFLDEEITIMLEVVDKYSEKNVVILQVKCIKDNSTEVLEASCRVKIDRI